MAEQNPRYAKSKSALRFGLLTLLVFVLGSFPTLLSLPSTSAADQLDELLKSKQLKKFGDKKVVRGDKLNYKLRPWFNPDSALERLFSDRDFAPELLQSLMPTDPNYQTGAPRIVFERTHVHLDVLVLDRKRKNMFQLTVLVLHPAFATMIDSDLIDDFAQRQPPRLKAIGEQELMVGEIKGTKYSLRSERCSALFKLTHDAWIELRSVEVCGTQNGLAALADQIDLRLFEQKLKS